VQNDLGHIQYAQRWLGLHPYRYVRNQLRGMRAYVRHLDGPPFELIGRINDFSGVLRVTSEKSGTMRPRELGVTGFRLRSAIFYPFSLYLIASD
jgi:hypothetical protein